MKKKILSVWLCAAVLLTGVTLGPFAPVLAYADQEQETTKASSEPVLAYVPLDNRPVNVDRVIYEAESAGFKVMMPEEDLYATRLDGQPLNSNGTQFGDGAKLLEWIQSMDEVTDYFVISLDQLLSGGLVNSRIISKTKYDEEYKRIDALIELSKNNHVYVVDTVARLSTCTVGYKNATLETYNFLRQYSIAPRHVLSDNALTINRIVSGYTRGADYKAVPIDSTYANDVKTALRTRERKLNLIDYMLTKDVAGRIHYSIGIDDSSSAITIQTNEINYIRKKMGDRGLIYSGTDELGMMATLRLMIDYYGYDVKAAVVYFGDTENSSAGSIYDMETVQENVEKHIASIGARLVSPEEADLEIVVLTTPAQPLLSTKYINRMIDYINGNISRGVPTIIINSAPGAYSGNFEYRMTRECEMSMLLSYSSWNTVGNSIGLALCNGVSRYLYLHSRTSSTDAADIAFLKGLIFSYEKDISYQRGGGKTLFNDYLVQNEWSASNFYQSDEQVKTVNAGMEYIFKTADYNVTVNDILDNLTGCRYFKGLGGACGIIGQITLSNYSAPFFRTFEIRFDIDVKLSDITLNGFNNAMTINIPYIPEDGQHTYAFTLYYMDESGKVQKVPSVYDKETGNIQFTTNQMPGFFTSILNIEAEKASSLFADVPQSAWYFDDVLYVYEKGIMQGTKENLFQPKTPMSRGMLAYTLYNMSGKPQPAGTADIPDDVEGRWYETAVAWTIENEIAFIDEEQTFRPSDGVTRAELADMLWRYASYAGEDGKQKDSPGIDHYADVFSVPKDLRDGMDWACRTGLISGVGTSGDSVLMPSSEASRAEVAAIIRRFVGE